nr:MAG TPA: hypothetical protein [Caudoviricetes sp.]
MNWFINTVHSWIFNSINYTVFLRCFFIFYELSSLYSFRSAIP